MIILSSHQTPNEEQAILQEGVIEQCGIYQIDCLLIPPLYDIAESCEFWSTLAKHAKNPVLACWLHPRPAAWLLGRHQIFCDETKIVNFHGFRDALSAFTALLKVAKIEPAEKKKKVRAKSGRKDFSQAERKLSAEASPRWYPIIDGSRCINCQHCLQFCLFGVYELDAEGKVQVRNPDQCKTGCPACSRICPQSAIMFPLYEKDEAIAGAPNRFVALDAAARRLFYTKTKRSCPLCGRKPNRKSPSSTDGENSCPECGGSLPGKKPAGRAIELSERPAFDDLDLLVEQLDQAMQQRPKQHE